MRTKTLLLVVLSMIITTATAGDEPWKDLFDGKSLYGWHQLNGEAKYEIVDGAIVGTSVLNTPNSFLCTKAHYSDFILELEFKVDPKLNTGVQIRSNSYPEYNNGRVHGYQIEIDPAQSPYNGQHGPNYQQDGSVAPTTEARRWTGGIYDEARRGWVHPLTHNPQGRKAFKPGQWNLMRVEAIGDTLKTWINDVPTAHLVDAMTDNGFIALQVHGIGRTKEKEGTTVQWRNIRIIDENVEAYTRSSPLPAHNNFNKLTSNEKKSGWKLLWDGKTTEGWHGAKIDHFPKSGWIIKDDTLTVLATGGGESTAGGDIVTNEKYSNFELCVDFKITAGANSGIKYFVDTELNKGDGSAIGLEFQILDDERHKDAKLGNHAGSRTVASLYDLIMAAPDEKHPRRIGEWNHAKIVSKGNHVEHWLNGRKVLEFERKSPEYRKLVAESKYKDWPSFGELPEGQILLQDHGDHVSFRNIKIKVLK
ncbi:DUF1080 domain-containing protein [Planctomycetota bacterium]